MPAQPELTPFERDKLRIDPNFDFKNDIAARPWEDLTTNEIGMFKWTGIYHQLQKGFFMLRLRLPGGLMTADQLERAAALAREFAQDQLCITTRQTLQFHWLRKEDLWKVLERMKEVGLDSINACGDVNRNVVTCPLQGVCPHEVKDVREMILRIADDPHILHEQRNLPRKHKMSVNGCGRACGQTLMNCESWYPVRRPAKAGGGEEIGWRYHAGGGLGARPFMAKTIFAWVPEDLVLEVTRAAIEVFRRLGNRRVRAFSRLKYVVHELGARGFGEKVLEVLRERNVAGLERIEFAEAPAEIGEAFVDGQGVIAQRQAGLSAVRVMIRRSEMTAAEAERFARWSREFGNGTILFTERQNLQLRFVPDARVPELVKALHEAGYATDGFERAPDMVACVGTTVCNLAVSDTPGMYRRLIDAFAQDEKLWREAGRLRIHMNGCPNSCAQHWIADIGLRGRRKEQGGGSEEGFTIAVGGSLAGQGHIAQPVCEVPSSQVVPTVKRLLELYLERRASAAEDFGAFTRRVGAPRLAEWLGHAPVPGEPVNDRNAALQDVFERAATEI